MTDKLKEERLLIKLKGWRNLIVKSKISYNWDRLEEEAYEQIRERLQKPVVTEAWYEEKAKEFLKLAYAITRTEPDITEHRINIKFIKEDFIRSLVEAMPAKKMAVSEGFVEKWGYKFPACTQLELSTNLKLIKQMLSEAGMEVVGK